jgi:hypothetical protein
MTEMNKLAALAVYVLLLCVWACGGPSTPPTGETHDTSVATSGPETEAEAPTEPVADADTEAVEGMDFEDGKLPDSGDETMESDAQSEAEPVEDPPQ